MSDEKSLMKFDVVVGNPPYQDGRRQLYADFYTEAISISSDMVSLIFPTGWQGPKLQHGLAQMNNDVIKKDCQIVLIDNLIDAFPGIIGAKETNIIMWKKDYDNKLNGKQLVYESGLNPKIIELPIDNSDIERPNELLTLAKLVKNNTVYPFESQSLIVSPRKPYGLESDAVTKPYKYNLPSFSEKYYDVSDISVLYGGRSSRGVVYVSANYPIPTINANLRKYKIFVSKAWGNMSNNGFLGGSYSDICIGLPNVACTGTFLESGSFDTYDMAKYHAKYLLSRFYRALLFCQKVSHNTFRGAYADIPIQDYSEPWWNESIDEIEHRLFDKYDVPIHIRAFVLNNIQPKTERNIVDVRDLIV